MVRPLLSPGPRIRRKGSWGTAQSRSPSALTATLGSSSADPCPRVGSGYQSPPRCCKECSCCQQNIHRCGLHCASSPSSDEHQPLRRRPFVAADARVVSIDVRVRSQVRRKERHHMTYRFFLSLALVVCAASCLVAAGCSSAESTTSAGAAGAGSSNGGGGSSGAAGGAGQSQELTRSEWARLLVTGPAIFLKCDPEVNGRIRLEFRATTPPCVDVAATDSCVTVSCHTPDVHGPKAPEEIVARTGGLTLTVPAGAPYVEVQGACGDTAEIQVGGQVVVVNTGAPLQCTYQVDPKSGVASWTASDLPDGRTFAALDLYDDGTGGADADTRSACVAAPGDRFIAQPTGGLFSGQWAEVACLSAEFRTVKIGGMSAFASAVRLFRKLPLLLPLSQLRNPEGQNEHPRSHRPCQSFSKPRGPEFAAPRAARADRSRVLVCRGRYVDIAERQYVCSADDGHRSSCAVLPKYRCHLFWGRHRGTCGRRCPRRMRRE